MCADRNENLNESEVSMLISLLKSTIFALALLALLTLFLSIVAMLFTMSAELVTTLQMIIMLIAVLAGGIYAGIKGRKRGWLTGGFLGLLFAAVLLALAGRYTDISLVTVNILRQFGIGFLVGALGGSIGVNLR